MRIYSKLIILSLGLFLTSCAFVPGGEVMVSDLDREAGDKKPSITLDQIEFRKITPQNTKGYIAKKRQPHRNAKLEAQKRIYSYKVGTGDILRVTVWEHPELSNVGGFLVDSQGFIFYPYVGRIKVSGRSIISIRELLSTALAKYIEKPQLDAAISKYASKKVYLTGEILKPSTIVMQSQPITLLDAITLSGGVSKSADLDDIVVVRKGKRRHIDLYALMHYGDMRQNILMYDGDQIHVASAKAKKTYVMGQVTDPVTIEITPEGLSLAEALGRARGINEASANASSVYVIRHSQKPGKVALIYQLDLSNMAAMVLASKFSIQNEDVIYVSKAPIVKWNQLLSVINPSIEIPGKIADVKTAATTIFN